MENREVPFNLKVNLIIMATIYFNTKKARCFEDDSDGQTTRKKKYLSLFHTGLFPISKNQYYKMLHNGFIWINEERIKNIAQMLGVNEKYMTSNNPEIFPVSNLTESDWNSYLKMADTWREEELTENEERQVQKVKDALKGLIREELPAHPNQHNPLFIIWYYVSHGKPYLSDDPCEEFLKALEKVNYSDWTDFDKTKRCAALLEKHYTFFKSYVTCKEMLKNLK